MRRVPVDILTGFLGAGKTTLLAELLATAGQRVAVVMNEIGEIGIDGRVLTGLEHVESMVELTSGCVCCTIEDASFDLALAELVERADPSLIVIETTGVADPAPTAARVERAGLGVDAVITAVDAEAFEIGWRLGRVARRQVDAADFLVLTKTDLVDEARLVRLERRLGRRNPRARLVRSRGGRLASGAVFGLGLRSAGPHVAPAPALEAPAGAAHGGHLAADSVEHFAWTSAGAMEPAALEAFLARLPASVWRAKGFARVPGNPWSCLFNFTCGRYQLSWIKLEEPPPTQAVFIGRGLAGDIRRDIEAGLAALVAPVDPAGLHSGAARGGQAQADATDVCVTDTRGNTGAE